MAERLVAGSNSFKLDQLARYGGLEQREALLKQVSGANSLSEAKGIVFAHREMRRLGYSLEDVSLHYRGKQGVDLVFSKESMYAVVEAKHGKYLSGLQTYAGGLRQGSLDYNINRLERYLQYGTGEHTVLVNRMLDDAALGGLESYASFYRGRATYELPVGWPSPNVPAIKR